MSSTLVDKIDEATDGVLAPPGSAYIPRSVFGIEELFLKLGDKQFQPERVKTQVLSQ